MVWYLRSENFVNKQFLAEQEILKIGNFLFILLEIANLQNCLFCKKFCEVSLF